MNAVIAPLANVGAGFVVVMAIMMVLCMGAMMFGMGRMGRGSGRGWSMPWQRFTTRETPVETLERRFAAGEISVEEYRTRRELLVNGAAQPNGDRDGEELSLTRSGEGRTR